MTRRPPRARRAFFLLAFSAFILMSTMNTTVECGSSNLSGTYTDECNCPDTSTVDRCKNDCDTIYGCGLALPDGQTGVLLSQTQCRSGCEENPGNVDCVDSCVDDYNSSLDCSDLESCVTSSCGVPIR